MNQFWAIAASVAGIGAIGLFVLYALYRQWLAHPSLVNQLTKQQIYRLMMLFLVLTFTTTAFAMYSFLSRNAPATSDFHQILPPIMSPVSGSGDAFDWTNRNESLTTAGAEQGVILDFSATNPNSFDLTVDHISVVVQNRIDGEGQQSMTHATGAAFQDTPQVTGELNEGKAVMPLTDSKGGKYIIDGEGDKAHFSIRLKGSVSGIYDAKVYLGISGLDEASEFEVGSVRFVLTDRMIESTFAGSPTYTYRFDR